MSMYYDWTKIEGYNAPITIVVSRRGLGKTFKKIYEYVTKFVVTSNRFIYVVETGEMVKELTKNGGEKFFSAIIEVLSEQNTSRKRYFYNKLTDLQVSNSEENEETKSEMFVRRPNTKVIGGAIKIAGDTAGYIVDMNSYAELKRNNFNKVKYIFVDEFISEKMDKTTLENPRKISSIVQSVARLRDIKLVLCGNAIRFDDPVLARMGFKIEKYGIYKKYDKYGLLAVLHFVDPKDYPEFGKAHDKSIAGRFATMLGETNEEENKFIEDLPKTRRLNTFKYKKGGFSVNLVKDNTIVTLRELSDGNIACVPFANKGAKKLFCLTEKEQGYKLGYHVVCNTELKKMIMNLLKADMIYYYSEVEYNQLKIIIKGDK